MRLRFIHWLLILGIAISPLAMASQTRKADDFALIGLERARAGAGTENA